MEKVKHYLHLIIIIAIVSFICYFFAEFAVISSYSQPDDSNGIMIGAGSVFHRDITFKEDIVVDKRATATEALVVGEDSNTATTTLMIGYDNSGGCLVLQDDDKNGTTYCSALNGTLNCTTTNLFCFD